MNFSIFIFYDHIYVFACDRLNVLSFSDTFISDIFFFVMYTCCCSLSNVTGIVLSSNYSVSRFISRLNTVGVNCKGIETSGLFSNKIIEKRIASEKLSFIKYCLFIQDCFNIIKNIYNIILPKCNCQCRIVNLSNQIKTIFLYHTYFS